MEKLLLFIALLAGSAAAQFAPAYGNITAQGSTCSTANACISIHISTPSQVQSVGIQLTGTFTATVQVEGSQDNGANWIAVPAIPIAGGASITSSTGTGNWAVSSAGLTDVRVRCSAYTSGTVAANLQPLFSSVPPGNLWSALPAGSAVIGKVGIDQTTPGTTNAVQIVSTVGDPCENPSVAKSSAVIAFSTATTTALVALSSGKVIYLCAWTISMSSGTTPTLLFKTGTQTTNPCDTGTVNLTGTMALPTTSGTFITVGAGHTMFQTPASFQLCITTAGTSPTGNGWATFVQQ